MLPAANREHDRFRRIGAIRCRDPGIAQMPPVSLRLPQIGTDQPCILEQWPRFRDSVQDLSSRRRRAAENASGCQLAPVAAAPRRAHRRRSRPLSGGQRQGLAWPHNRINAHWAERQLQEAEAGFQYWREIKDELEVESIKMK